MCYVNFNLPSFKTSHQQMQMRGVPEACVTRIPKPNSFYKSAQVSFLAAAWWFFFILFYIFFLTEELL